MATRAIDDLEVALARAEATRVSAAEDTAAEDTAAEDTAAEDTAAEDTAAEDTAEASAPRARPAVSLPAEPPKLSGGRFRLLPELKSELLPRQGAFIAWSALCGAVLAASGLAVELPLAAIAACVGLGAWAAFPKRVGRGPLVAAAAVAGALLTGVLLANEPWILVAGPELLVAGAIAGAGLAWLDGMPSDRLRTVHGALGGAACAGLGAWAAGALVGPLATASATGGAVYGAVLGLVGSQALVAAALTWHPTDRLPRPGRIRATLAEPYRAPALRAWQLDQGFERQAPDVEVRDGLGEVAAWIYRLQWTLQALDRELGQLDQGVLEDRRRDLLQRAADAEDEFTAERLQATARHLAQLDGHRSALARERDRTDAMSEYASAFLEEARAGLALAKVQPGEHAPERLGDVLRKLRSHATEQDTRRRTRREVGTVAA